ncbi:hypothetical protein KKR89_12315 [Cellulomonas dongxiuzhuiae]|uniref:Uncharacterized protein n=1 Tax=Cellulomonas dongxiuzhuiae TaxID=2819979 RepID=A0ABX8GGV7_9CELL|nr:hypothetical protein [Cellulomonas dongxiuzhuiae]QWC15107.1 hypothetical protein KKR89_12315 [Cellulomonas dongxiuzhuiae]
MQGAHHDDTTLLGAESIRCSSCQIVEERVRHRHASDRPNRRRPPYFL